MLKKFKVGTAGQGLYEITNQVKQILNVSGVSDGLAVVFIRHTSASLLIQENADPSAKYDLERWYRRLVKEQDPLYTHIFEGIDDMPSHIKASLTNSDLSIPVQDAELCLGTWQGVYLFEHRDQPHTREILIKIISDK